MNIQENDLDSIFFWIWKLCEQSQNKLFEGKKIIGPFLSRHLMYVADI